MGKIALYRSSSQVSLVCLGDGFKVGDSIQELGGTTLPQKVWEDGPLSSFPRNSLKEKWTRIGHQVSGVAFMVVLVCTPTPTFISQSEMATTILCASLLNADLRI